MRAFGFLLIAVLGVAAFEGCGSSDSTTGSSGSNSKFDAGGNCNPAMCPNTMGNARPCCAAGQCGYDYGLGCVVGRKDAGQ